MKQSTLHQILKEITWDAGLVVRRAFRGLHKAKKKTNKPTEYVRFTYKGNWYRRPIASKKKSKPPELLSLPPAGAQVVPKPFKNPDAAAAEKAEVLAAVKAKGSSSQDTWSWRSWWKLNAPLLVLNFGFFANLVGFTRADVLELRSLAMTGNTSFVIYSLFNLLPFDGVRFIGVFC